MNLRRFRPFRPAAPAAPTLPKSAPRQWLDSLLFAVVVASLFRWSAAEAYVIPSESMEPTVLVGEYVVVSKLHYGPITPQTPLQVPLTHQKDPLFGLKSYSDLIQLPSYRLPGFGAIRRNDVVVFHLPHEPQLLWLVVVSTQVPLQSVPETQPQLLEMQLSPPATLQVVPQVPQL